MTFGRTASGRRAAGWCAAKEYFVKFALAKVPGEFAEGEEGHQGAQDDDGARDELGELDLVQDGARGFVVDEALDELLEEVEGEDEQAEGDGLEYDGLVEGTGLGAAANMHHVADEDDLADDEGVDEGEGVVQS